jgi:hypothetical protein
VIQYVNFVIVAEGDFEFSFFNTRDQSMVPAGNLYMTIFIFTKYNIL